MGMQFNPAHVASVATLNEFLVSRKAMLASTPISQNPSLYERTQAIEDDMLKVVRVFKGDIINQQDSVDFDNEVADEQDRRRFARRRVITSKRSFLNHNARGAEY